GEKSLARQRAREFGGGGKSQAGRPALRTVGGAGGVCLPQLHGAHSRFYVTQSACHLVVDVFGDVFGGGIQFVERGVFVEPLVVEAIEDGVHYSLKLDEID